MPWSVILMSEVHRTQFQSKHSHSGNFSQGPKVTIFRVNFFNFLLLQQSICPKWSWWNLCHPLLLRQLFSSSISGGRSLQLLMACYTCYSLLAGQTLERCLYFHYIQQFSCPNWRRWYLLTQDSRDVQNYSNTIGLFVGSFSLGPRGSDEGEIA